MKLILKVGAVILFLGLLSLFIVFKSGYFKKEIEIPVVQETQDLDQKPNKGSSSDDYSSMDIDNLMSDGYKLDTLNYGDSMFVIVLEDSLSLWNMASSKSMIILEEEDFEESRPLWINLDTFYKPTAPYR